MLLNRSRMPPWPGMVAPMSLMPTVTGWSNASRNPKSRRADSGGIRSFPRVAPQRAGDADQAPQRSDGTAGDDEQKRRGGKAPPTPGAPVRANAERRNGEVDRDRGHDEHPLLLGHGPAELVGRPGRSAQRADVGGEQGQARGDVAENRAAVGCIAQADQSRRVGDT